jgi:large subunit ribosomal protein L21
MLQKKGKSCRVWAHMAETKTTPTSQKLRGAGKKESKNTPAKAKKAPSKEVKPKVVKDVILASNGSFAIIETGGKQYRVSVGDTIKVDKLQETLKVGDSVAFDKVLLIDNGTDVTDIGTPYVVGAKVSGTLVEIGRNAKVIVLKYKQKSRYMKKNGHRQPFFKIKIEKIS